MRPPSVDAVLREAGDVVARFGRQAAVGAVRGVLEEVRAGLRAGRAVPGMGEIVGLVAGVLERGAAASLRPVLNLTGTVLHTNLGRAVLAEGAIEAAVGVMRGAAALEYDVATGGRGERDDHVRGLLCELTGAEDALVVNNNAAAVLLALAALAGGRESVVSRGELIEIGGAFRMPDIMASAGTVLVEVGTTNRTHKRDYEGAIGARTALLMKVHTSNYRIEGFTAEVSTRVLAGIGKAAGVPVLDDLGSGTLVDLSAYGLPRERTVADAIGDGADVVTYSGDKLLGGPQAGFIVGRRDLVRACARHPLKRALRVDKIRMAALEATLRLYRDPDRLAERLPTLRVLARGVDEIRAMAEAVAPAVAAWAGGDWVVEVVECRSQIGSGAMPVETLASTGLALRPVAGGSLEEMAGRLRGLAVPVIGSIREGAVRLDMRCLERAGALVEVLA